MLPISGWAIITGIAMCIAQVANANVNCLVLLIGAPISRSAKQHPLLSRFSSRNILPQVMHASVKSHAEPWSACPSGIRIACCLFCNEWLSDVLVTAAEQSAVLAQVSAAVEL